MTHHLPGLFLRPHCFEVPLDWSATEGERIEVFGREVVASHLAEKALPWLVFLQGGPGFASPRPPNRGGWLRRATEEYRVLLLDQRGTGASSPLSFRSFAGSSATEVARILECYRADSIVRDCESIRERLIGADTRWSLLGQSFGGFCCTHYLSVAPESLREVYITGGLPPLNERCCDVYRRTYPQLRRKNEQYWQRFPEDEARLRDLVQHLAGRELRLPTGDRLTPRRFRQIGLHLGMSDGADLIHYLLEEPWIDGEPSYTFLRNFENSLHYDTNPIFSVLHEACYTQGFASRWAASRVKEEFPEFGDEAEGTPLLMGEMIEPWMFEEYRTLAPFAEAAHRLAEKEDWARLYHPEVLAANEIPVAAAIYANDMYVDRGFSEQTASNIKGLRPWLTDEYEHNGLRADGGRVLGRLIDLVRGNA